MKNLAAELSALGRDELLSSENQLLIGLTYDLKSSYLAEGYSAEEVAELDSPATIDAIETALIELGYRVERIGNIKELVFALTHGKRWDLVFNICEGLHGVGREAQVPALLEAYQIPAVFSDVTALALTLHKGYTKNIIRDHRLPTAPFAVINSATEIEKVKLPYPLFVKPAAEGTGKGVDGSSKIETPEELERVCREKLERYRQPLLVESYLPGREFTVGILGSGERASALGTLEIRVKPNAPGNTYSYESKAYYEEFIDYLLADDELARRCEAVALAAWRVLGCRDGGRVDLKLDGDGLPNFLEVNPLAGLHPIDSDLPILARLLGVEYRALIGAMVSSATERLPTTKRTSDRS